MGFRDDNMAHNARLEAERIERVRQERIAREREEKRQKAIREWEKKMEAESSELSESEQSTVKSFKKWFGKAKSNDEDSIVLWRHDGFYHERNYKPWLIGAGFVGFVFLLVFTVYYHEEYSLREGIVTNKDYTPGHTTTSCTTNNGHTSCSSHYHPPEWEITVSYGGENGTWEVEERDYNFIQYGQWWCARDWGYVCRGPQNTNVSPEFYTLSGEQEGRQNK